MSQVVLHPPRPAHPLRVYRTAQGRSQSAVAREAGVARTTIVRIEAGAVPTLRTANAVANVLGVEVDVLFPDDQETDIRPVPEKDAA